MKLFSAHWVFPLNHVDLIRNGAVVIEGDKIVALGEREELERKYPNAERQHFEKSVLMPGLVNAHCHLDRVGLYERFTVKTDTPPSTVTWLLEGLRYLSRTPASTVADRMENAVKNILATGTTCIGAMTHYEGAFPLLKSTPLRGVVFQEILSGPDKRAQQRFEVALALIDQYYNAKPNHLKIGLGPYSAYLLSRNLLNIISRHATDNGLPLQLHAAESFDEMEFFFESSGEIATKLFPAIGWDTLPPAHRKTPVQHLEDIGFFTGPLSMVGGYHMSATDFPRLARGLARIVYCPGANRRFNLGDFPLKKLKEQGIPIALGTEILSHAEGFDLWEEMRIALQGGSQPLPEPLELLKMATRNGALALGFEKEIGTLEPGKQADFIVVKEPQPVPADFETLCRELILQTEAKDIQRVIIAGQNEIVS